MFIFLFLVGAIANQLVFQANRKRHHKFYMTWVMFGFCMARVATHVLRIAWTTQVDNPHLAIAALIFTNIGVLIIYMVILLMAMRVFRATHPKWGWNKGLRTTTQVAYYLLGGALVLVIAFSIVSFYTLNATIKSVALWIQRVAILYMMIFNVVSMTLLLLSALLPRASNWENFGAGTMESKLIILGTGVFFIVFIAGFRLGVIWAPARPASRPPWYDSKPAFYVIYFGFEVIIVYLLLLTRFDRRFWVPNGSNGPGDYSRVSQDGAALQHWMEPDSASDQGKPE